ncbi:MAG TPA: hypothetical protein VGX23_14745 [Actinocrinis sp.]|nr:hypothetical protein [Actinocrinis sp.]
MLCQTRIVIRGLGATAWPTAPAHGNVPAANPPTCCGTSKIVVQHRPVASATGSATCPIWLNPAPPSAPAKIAPTGSPDGKPVASAITCGSQHPHAVAG